MADQHMKLSVDTGSMLFDIDDKGEVIGQFRFNPSDPDIARRYEKVIHYFETVSIAENATDEELFAFTDELKKQFDYLLNYNVSDDIFSKANPLTPTANGDFYCENVLNGIGTIIESVTEQRLKKKQAKIRKATAKYHK